MSGLKGPLQDLLRSLHLKLGPLLPPDFIERFVHPPHQLTLGQPSDPFQPHIPSHLVKLLNGGRLLHPCEFPSRLGFDQFNQLIIPHSIKAFEPVLFRNSFQDFDGFGTFESMIY